MAGENCQDISARRKRVEGLKRLIAGVLLFLWLMPFVFCIVLLFQVHSLNVRTDKLADQVADMKVALQQVALEQEKMKEAPQVSVSVGQGDVPDANAMPSQPTGADADVADVPAEESIAQTGVVPEEPAMLHKVYLTFDDGPSSYTGEILDILSAYDVKATFFVVGKEDEKSQNAIKRIVEEGHTLGMHSYSHKYSDIYKSADSFSEDLDKLQNYLYDLTGVWSGYYRFPGGSSNKVCSENIQEFAEILDSREIMFYDWNIASGDGGSQLLGVNTLVRNSTSELEQLDTAIILMHDSSGKPTTVEALPAVIEKILGMEDTVILPITDETVPVQHIHRNN